MKRRSFLSSAAVSAVAWGPGASVVAALAKDDRYRASIGLQMYTLRNEVAKDAAATVRAVAEAGYRQVELYRSAQTDEMIRAAKDCGLAVHSMHFDWNTVVAPKDEAMGDFRKVVDDAKGHGLSHLVIPYLDESQRRTLDDYRKVAERCNRAAVLARAAGMQLSYHHHAFEFEPMEGGRHGFEILSTEFAPEMMFELDVFWVKAAGFEPVELMECLKGRVSQVHLKDMKAGVSLPMYTGMPADGFKELGNGIIPMEPILKRAAEIGVVHCHVEQDQSPDPLASVRQSVQYLAQL
jgi:sugar phosphate isomerase/epimerase